MGNKRKLIIIGIALSILIIVVVIFAFLIKISDQKSDSNSTSSVPNIYFTTLADGTKLNTSPKLKMSKQFEGLDITGIQVTAIIPTSTDEAKNSMIKGRTEILATITNNTTETLGGYGVNITFVDDKGNPISKSKAYVEIIELAPGESTQLNGGITENLVNAYDIKIEKAIND